MGFDTNNKLPIIRGGYILQPRIIQDSDISKAPPYVREIWAYLLREANSADCKYGGNTIMRGQLFRDYKTIREDLSWFVGYRKMMYNENHTKKAMKALREAGRITTSKELGGVLITICNYEYYQNPKNYESTNESTDDSTTKEPMKNQPIPDTNKNDKNKKKEEDKNKEKSILNIPLSQVDKSTLDQETYNYFEIAFAFWQLVLSNLEELGINSSTAKAATFGQWVPPIRLLIEKDKRTIDEIRSVFRFVRDDDFWRGQILSTAKLRKKNKNDISYFEELLIKSKNAEKRKSDSSSRTIPQSTVSDNYKRSILERLLHSDGSEDMSDDQ